MKFLSIPKHWINFCLVWAVVAHLLFLVAEMFLWQTSFMQEILLGGFTTAQKAEILAHNVGLYNGFLSAGALWGLLAMNPKIPKVKPAVFILVCAFIAGIYGSISLGRPTAFLLQSLPSIIALPLIWLNNDEEEQ
ncbi:DUF1304 domain-containing protein [Nostoc sp. 'Peltigera membranacea cyanobiont' N6]|uniref:DUF1304 domain-containing protein n=1 Tax=Nostoc sp. 'Peltigera membranacea cyanobiont' N6 TaxID=1261031 RepID=UPI000CF335FC|nr:DUF1304 domain-containing protein [Nostoc sp. 'Peltigera membranacea cyanobiont' N6]AVH63584.1 membrane protein of unknown function DUF1304 [Nostoc sp. 'Peltigera membranacea cyanobiont' N6]